MGARRGAIDLVGQEDLREDGSALEVEAVAAARILLEDAHAEDVGWHEVGRALKSAKGEAQTTGDGAYQGRFAEAGGALDQDVSAGEQGVEEIVSRGALVDEAALDGIAEGAGLAAQVGDLFLGRLAQGVGLKRVSGVGVGVARRAGADRFVRG